MDPRKRNLKKNSICEVDFFKDTRETIVKIVQAARNKSTDMDLLISSEIDGSRLWNETFSLSVAASQGKRGCLWNNDNNWWILLFCLILPWYKHVRYK